MKFPADCLEALDAVRLAERRADYAGKAFCVVAWGGKLDVVTEATAKRRGQAVLETVRPFLCGGCGNGDRDG